MRRRRGAAGASNTRHSDPNRLSTHRLSTHDRLGRKGATHVRGWSRAPRERPRESLVTRCSAAASRRLVCAGAASAAGQTAREARVEAAANWGRRAGAAEAVHVARGGGAQAHRVARELGCAKPRAPHTYRPHRARPRALAKSSPRPHVAAPLHSALVGARSAAYSARVRVSPARQGSSRRMPSLSLSRSAAPRACLRGERRRRQGHRVERC